MTIKQRTLLLKVLIHTLSLGLVANVFYLAIVDQLGADPVEEVLHFTGIGALNLLILSCAVSPVAKKLRAGWLMQVRRLIGLYSFFYAFLHVISFWAFEIQFDITLFLSELVERPFITVGLVSVLILMVLAITSISALKRYLASRWQTIHNWVYLALALAGVHFIWSVKTIGAEPVIYVLAIVILLSLRKARVVRWVKAPFG